MKPRIALTLSRQNAPGWVGHARYVAALERAGADVVPVYPTDSIPSDFDGVLLSGGGDVAPERYGEADIACANVDAERDAIELALAAEALARDVPILGICRGFQVLNVARGGGLVQHVDGHEAGEGGVSGTHEGVIARSGSLLAAAIGTEPVTVNSRHHQSVSDDRLGENLVPTVHVDGLVEALEATDRSWVVGVQWHPERTAEVSAAAARIFDAFVAATEARRQ